MKKCQERWKEIGKNNTRQGVLKVEDKIHMEGKVVEVKGGN